MANPQVTSSEAVGGASIEAGHGEASYRVYFTTWLWLLVLTLLEIGLVLTQVPRAVLVTCLLILTVCKASFIFANFMHLRFERWNLLFVALTPLMMGVILFFGVAPDF